MQVNLYLLNQFGYVELYFCTFKIPKRCYKLFVCIYLIFTLVLVYFDFDFSQILEK